MSVLDANAEGDRGSTRFDVIESADHGGHRERLSA